MAKKKKRTLLRKKFRISIINEETWEEVKWMRLSANNVLISLIVLMTIVGGGSTALVIFTPLKEYIPGFPDASMQQAIVKNAFVADSLENKLHIYERYLNSIKTILQGELPPEMYADTSSSEISPNFMERALLEPSAADSVFRAEIEEREKYNLQEFWASETDNSTEMLLYKPVKGVVSNKFKPSEGHLGFDVVTAPGEKVLAVADGTVVFAEWTMQTGNVIQIQHDNNLVSIYKHNSLLTKKVGEKVKAGEAIAVVGNSGEMTTGPHLHLELWKNGEPIDPELYIVF